MSDWGLHLLALGAAVLVVRVVWRLGYRVGHAAGYAEGHDVGYRAGGLAAARTATHNLVLKPAILHARHVAKRTEAQRPQVPQWTRWQRQWQRKGGNHDYHN